MLLTYEALSRGDLRGALQADYLVALDAELRILDGPRVIWAEPGFPVVELARSLRPWLADPERQDFEFDSMAYENVGAVTTCRESFPTWFLDVGRRGHPCAGSVVVAVVYHD